MYCIYTYVQVDMYHIHPELGKLLYESNILLITNYFYEEVIYVLQLHTYYSIKKVTPLYYYYVLSKVIILCNLVTSYQVTLKIYL